MAIPANELAQYSDSLAALATKVQSLATNGMSSGDKLSFIDIVNKAITNSDDIRTNMITTVNSKLGTSMTTNKTWAEIQSAINGAALGKKWASGSATVSSNKITVTGLSFAPKLVFVAGNNLSDNYTFWVDFSLLPSRASDAEAIVSYNGSSYTWDNNSSGVVPSASGFTALIYNTNAALASWIAFE